MTDVLSDIFDTIRLKGTLYFRTNFSPPFAITVPRYHQTARFHLVAQGRCHVGLASGRTADISAGDLILIMRGQEHTVADQPGRRPVSFERVVQESGYSGRGVFVIGAGDPQASTQMICGHLGFAHGADHPLLRALPEMIVMTAADRWRNPLLDETLRLMARAAFGDGLGAGAAITRLSEVFFIEAVRASVERFPELARMVGAMTDAQIGRALELVHQSPAEAWSVDRLAGEVGMSRSRFAERFTDLVGMAPMAYVSEWRLQKALARLGESEISVKEVARQVGYQSAAAFTRAFSQRFGAPPSDHRVN